MMKGGRNNGGRGHRPEPQPWKDQIQMRFGDRLVNVRSPALTRDSSEARRFVREHTDLASSDSFSRIITFDTECSVNYADYCEMCSFGYAEYDLEGNEIAREEIYIRAREPKGRLREKCQADYSKFKDAPKWELQYQKIREILSPFELSVFHLWSEGYSASEIALHLERTEKSVSNALARSLAKLRRTL